MAACSSSVVGDCFFVKRNVNSESKTKNPLSRVSFGEIRPKERQHQRRRDFFVKVTEAGRSIWRTMNSLLINSASGIISANFIPPEKGKTLFLLIFNNKEVYKTHLKNAYKNSIDVLGNFRLLLAKTTHLYIT